MRDNDVANLPTVIDVVAAAIRDANGLVLLQQRPEGKHHAGLWEFPGGKVEQGENRAAALVREIAEELDLLLDHAALHLLGQETEVAPPSAPAGAAGVVLILYNAPLWRGLPQGLEGQQWGWFTLSAAAALPLAPMDRRLLRLIP
jgi:8-oxo-dGTP diphosphatase